MGWVEFITHVRFALNASNQIVNVVCLLFLCPGSLISPITYCVGHCHSAGRKCDPWRHWTSKTIFLRVRIVSLFMDSWSGCCSIICVLNAQGLVNSVPNKKKGFSNVQFITNLRSNSCANVASHPSLLYCPSLDTWPLDTVSPTYVLWAHRSLSIPFKAKVT